MSKPRSAGRQFLGSSRQPQRSLPHPRRRKRIRVFLPNWERMEDRTMLSTMLWANPASGNWDVASNWVNQANPADHHVPIASDDAEINVSGITVTHSAGTDTVQSVTSSSNLTLSGGTLTVTGTVQVS